MSDGPARPRSGLTFVPLLTIDAQLRAHARSHRRNRFTALEVGARHAPRLAALPHGQRMVNLFLLSPLGNVNHVHKSPLPMQLLQRAADAQRSQPGHQTDKRGLISRARLFNRSHFIRGNHPIFKRCAHRAAEVATGYIQVQNHANH